MPVCYLGIDPGLSGAIAFFYPDDGLGKIVASDMPVAGGEIDAATLSDVIAAAAPQRAVIELVHAMPKQGVSSTFKFGQSYGTLLGILSAIKTPVDRVRPNEWKKWHRLGPEKDDARALALRLWPSAAGMLARKKDHGKAEAALMAYWLWKSGR